MIKMTEEQMHKRMREIDEERDKLRAERQEYENYFVEKRKEEKLKSKKNFVGKCYCTKGLNTNREAYVKAFRILQLLENPSENHAVCVALIDGYRKTCCQEYGIQIMTLPLWCPNEPRMISRETDPDMFDFYEEITQEEFEQMSSEYLNNLMGKAKNIQNEKYCHIDTSR